MKQNERPRFSIIMQSYLGEYKNSASNKEVKLIRAIESVINQTFTDWELIIIADGCEKTFDLVCDKFINEHRIDCRLISKQTTWGGAQRNYGISIAKGELINYLDADDMLGVNHLQKINDNIKDLDWCYYNDIVKGDKVDTERTCIINIKYQHGTSNITHKSSLQAKWTSYGYGLDDWGLVQHLLKLSKNYNKIETPEYIVCHVPRQVDL